MSDMSDLTVDKIEYEKLSIDFDAHHHEKKCQYNPDETDYEKINEELDLCRHQKNTYRAKLDVIAVVSNPVRFQRRYQLFNEFCARMKKDKNVRLLTVELQQRNRPFATDSTVKLRTNDEIWHKENLINIGVQHLPDQAEYIAWIDADIEFQNKNWSQETIEQLQCYDVVQLFSHAIDLGPNGETMIVHTGFNYLYVNDEPMSNYSPGAPYRHAHSGYAWACRKSAYNAMGGLMEFPILGSADSHMAMAFIGKVGKTLHPKLNKNYKELCFIFQERCERHIKRNIGYVPGTINHFFHSDKQNRQYSSRWNILLNNDFDPLRDLKKDNNNLWQLEDLKPRLRDDIKKYFRQRQEDSIDLKQDYNLIKMHWI
jgi:hypothetical protein